MRNYIKCNSRLIMNLLERIWYSKSRGAGWLLLLLLRLLLLPLELLFRAVVGLRRPWRWMPLPPRPPWMTVPVVVVGNISVGGTGKTPLLMALVEHLKSLSMKPGVISRGYGGKAAAYPLLLDSSASLPDPSQCGDEPLLIAEKTRCPVVVHPNRRTALQHLLEKYPQVDVVFSDDGLQHYQMRREIEVAVVDGERMFGNGHCLPAGPLREPLNRLFTTDYVVINGGSKECLEEKALARLEGDPVFFMTMKPRYLSNLRSGEKLPISGSGDCKLPFKAESRVQAVAGIGNPARFFRLLESLSCMSDLAHPLSKFRFPDHHRFTLADFQRAGIDLQQPVIMTEKDGVKCRDFATDQCWVLEVEAELSDEFLSDFDLEVVAWETDIENILGEAANKASGGAQKDAPEDAQGHV